jgi:hypothetical protein
MSRILPTKRFEEIASDAECRQVIAPWIDLIPVNQPCVDVLYKHGEEIGDFSKYHKIELSKPVGFVLKGRAELYESYELASVTSYRPIRLLVPGDLFGDFSILDDRLECTGPSRRGEGWKFCAGTRSILLKQLVEVRHRNHFRGDDGTLFEPHRFLDHHSSDLTTRVVFIDSSFVGMVPDDQRAFPGKDFFDKLIRYSWPRAKIYRDCLNSFNFRELLLFKENAYKVYAAFLRRKERGSDRPKYAQDGAKENLLGIFLDAIWDACNRPVRSEPMFVAQSKALLGAGAQKALEKYRIKLDNVLIAAPNESQNELWFPVDKHNYMVALYAKAYIDSANDDQSRKFMSNLLTILGAKQVVQRGSIQLSSRTLYRDLADALIGEITRGHEHYPYNVSCEDIVGFDGRLMILRFVKKRQG